MNKRLQAFIEVAPLINQLITSDVAISICDLTKCLLYVPGKKLNHRITIGTEHLKDSVSYQCIKKRKRLVKRVGSEVFGFPYICFALPVFDGNEIVGSVSFNESVDRQDLLSRMASDLTFAMKGLANSTQNIEDSTIKHKGIGMELQEIEAQSKVKVDETFNILNFIRDISKHINIVGINASIEAARLGDKGKGFGVVAEEIRKLTSTTDEYIKKVDTILQELKTCSEKINNKVDQMTVSSVSQEKSIQEINHFAQEVYAMVEQISEQSMSLTKEE